MERGVDEPAPWREVFRGRDGRLIVGLLLFETLGAVHILVVAAVMPAVLRDLGNLPLYGWAFSAAALAMIGTIPIVGAAVDRFGAKPLVLSTAALYLAGLLISALAPSMAVLVVGRFVQGAASGSAYALSLGTVAKTLSPAIRPRVLALMATSWLLPGLLGPPIGGFLADSIGWRWAFVVPIPFLALSVVMIYPVLRGEPDPEAAPAPILRALVLMLGTALFLAGVDGRSVASGAAARDRPRDRAARAARHRRAGHPARTPGRAGRGDLRVPVVARRSPSIDSYVPLMLTGVRGMSVFRAGLDHHRGGLHLGARIVVAVDASSGGVRTARSWRSGRCSSSRASASPTSCCTAVRSR